MGKNQIIHFLSDLKKVCRQLQGTEGAMSFTAGLYYPGIMWILGGVNNLS